MKTLNAHVRNGWNYGINIASGKVQLFRYYTNGHQNSNFQKKGWVKVSPITILTEKELEVLEYEFWDKIDMEKVYSASDHLEACFFNGI